MNGRVRGRVVVVGGGGVDEGCGTEGGRAGDKDGGGGVTEGRRREESSGTPKAPISKSQKNGI